MNRYAPRDRCEQGMGTDPCGFGLYVENPVAKTFRDRQRFPFAYGPWPRHRFSFRVNHTAVCSEFRFGRASTAGPLLRS